MAVQKSGERCRRFGRPATASVTECAVFQPASVGRRPHAVTVRAHVTARRGPRTARRDGCVGAMGCVALALGSGSRRVVTCGTTVDVHDHGGTALRRVAHRRLRAPAESRRDRSLLLLVRRRGRSARTRRPPRRDPQTTLPLQGAHRAREAALVPRGSSAAPPNDGDPSARPPSRDVRSDPRDARRFTKPGARLNLAARRRP